MPMVAGLAALLILGVATSLLVGRTSPRRFDVPKPLLAYQTGLTDQIADSVRRGSNEGAQDLAEAIQLIVQAGVPRGTRVDRALESLLAIHDRYRTLYLLDPAGRVMASRGGNPWPKLLDPPPPYTDPVVQPPRQAQDGSEVLLEAASATVAAPGGGTFTLVGEYNPDFIERLLQPALPGNGWLLDPEGRIIGALDRSAPFSQLGDAPLRAAADRANRGDDGSLGAGKVLDDQSLIGFAPVSGSGPAGGLGWVVVTDRSVVSFDLPQTEVRRQGILVGALEVVLALIVFGWLYAVLLRPILRLGREAERLVYGDLSRSVEIVRYDEIGLISRALERLRIVLIGKDLPTRAVGRPLPEPDGAPSTTTTTPG